MHSIRTQFVAFIAALLLILLLLLNIFPLSSSRDAVFEEKRSSMTAQASTVASSLSTLEPLNGESIAEGLRYLDLRGYSRILVTDREGRTLYDSDAAAATEQAKADLVSCLAGQVDDYVRTEFPDRTLISFPITILCALYFSA